MKKVKDEAEKERFGVLRKNLCDSLKGVVPENKIPIFRMSSDNIEANDWQLDNTDMFKKALGYVSLLEESEEALLSVGKANWPEEFGDRKKLLHQTRREADRATKLIESNQYYIELLNAFN